MKKSSIGIAIFSVFLFAAACHATVYQDFEVGNGSDEYAWPINSANIVLIGGSEPHFGGRALRIGGPGFAGAGIQSQTERWDFDCQPELNDRLSFWIYGAPLDNSDNTVSVRFFDQGNYHAGGFEVWTTQSFRHGQWTQLKVLFSQLPPDFNLHRVDKIEIVNYAAGVHYVDSIEVHKDDRVYQAFELSLRAGSSASDFGWKWNDADSVGLSAPGEPVYDGEYSWKLVAAARWSGFGLQSQEKKLVVNPDGSSFQDFWHVDLDPAHNTLLSFWVYGLAENQMDNNVSVQFYDHDQHNTDDTKVVYWTKVAARYGAWTRLVVPFDELLAQPGAADLHLEDLNKIQVQIYWPGTYYFDEFRASTAIPKILPAALPQGQIQWEVAPGTDYRLYEGDGGPSGNWNQIWDSFTDPLHNGNVPITRLTPVWYRVNHSDPVRYEPAVITIDSTGLRQGAVSWKTIPQTDTYEVQSAPTKDGPWSRFYLGLPVVQQARPGDWYRARAVHVDTVDTVTEASAWGPAIADTAEAGFVRANRTDLRERNGLGEVILLRGVNLGGVFINEPWMTGIGEADNPQIPDEYSLRQTLESRFGVAAARQLQETFQQAYLQEYDFDLLLRLGFNTVRLPIYFRQFQDEAGNWILNNQGQIDFGQIDRVIKFCADRGIYVVLDLHGAPGSQNNEIHSGRGGYNRLFENSATGLAYRNRTVSIWQQLATHFRDEPAIAGYDLLNEPVGAPLPQDLWALYDRLYDAIRAIDSNHLVIMEGIFDWDTLPSPASYGWENVLYQFHYYHFGFGEDLASHQQYMDERVALAEIKQREYQVPAMVGEFNSFSLKGIWDYYLAAFNQQGWSWMPWSYKFHNSPSDWGLFTHAYYDELKPLPSTDSLQDLTRKFSKYDTANHHAPNYALQELLMQSVGQPVKHPPVLGAIANRSVNEGQSLTIVLSATDPDNDPVSFQALNAPAGAYLANNTFTWTPGFNQSGEYAVTFIATDGGLEDAQQVTLTVVNVPLTATSLVDSVDPFSPNGDGVQETTTLTGQFNHVVSVGKLVVYNSAGKAIRAWVDQNVSQVQHVWDGRNNAGARMPAGTYTYTLVGVDSGNSIATRSITGVIAFPDLIISSLTHSPASPASGSPVTITAVVSNSGTMQSGPSSVHIRVGGETYPPSYAIGQLAAGATQTLTRTLTLTTRRGYLVTATADPSNTLLESNESNNSRTDSFTVH